MKNTLAFNGLSQTCRTHPNQPQMQMKGNKILPNLLYVTKVCY